MLQFCLAFHGGRVTLQGKSEDEIRSMQSNLVAKLDELGGKAGNSRLMRDLGWDSDVYWLIRDRLVDSGVLVRLKGRGGAVAFVGQPQAAPQPIQPVAAVQPGGMGLPGVVQPTERVLYEPVAEVLRGPWARDSRFRHQVVEITASQGRRDTGGTWTRPDVVVAALRIFPFLPGKYLDLITFEIKPSWALDVTGVYEALAHRRAATQSYLWLHCPDPQQVSDRLERIVEEAERHGIGVIAASDPSNYDTWDQKCTPTRVDPDPELLNDFVAVQLSEGAKEELSAWVR
jgi:hypothetical protein